MREMPTASSLMSEWGAIVALLSNLMDLNSTASVFGALKRRRGVKTAEALLRLCLGYGPGGMSLREAAAWAGATGIATLADTSLLERLRNSVAWLAEIVRVLLTFRIKCSTPKYNGRKIRIVDGTTISKPGSSGTDYRIHAEFDLSNWSFAFFKLTDKHTAEDLRHAPIEPGEIKVADRGYAKKNQMLEVVKAGADFVIRTGWRSLSLLNDKLKPLNLFEVLEKIEIGTMGDIPVFIRMGAKEKPLALRLIVIRKTEEETEKERLKVLRRCSKKQHNVDERSLVAARYIMIITSLSTDWTAQDIASLYRFRWQIELAFKRLKSILSIGDLRAFDPRLAQAWIYSHLIAALLADTEIQDILESFPSGPRGRRVYSIPLACGEGGLPEDHSGDPRPHVH